MPDLLAPSDLQTFTQGRLSAYDPNTILTLDAALVYVRNHCRWHVSPVVTEEMSFNGPGQWGGLAVGIGGLYYASGSYLTGVLRRVRTGADTLVVPTKHLLGVTSVIEDGVELDVSTDINWSKDGRITKSNGQPWTANFANGDGLTQGISVTFEHGYSADDAADWKRIVLMVADRMSMVRGLIGAFSTNMGPYRVNAYFGESRTGSLPSSANWLDDLMALLHTGRYVRVDDW